METVHITFRGTARPGPGRPKLVEADLFLEVGDWLEFVERPDDGSARVVRVLKRSEMIPETNALATRYVGNLVRSAIAPETIVAAVAANTAWKIHFAVSGGVAQASESNAPSPPPGRSRSSRCARSRPRT